MGANHKVSKQNYFSALLEISNVSEFNPLEIHKNIILPMALPLYAWS